MDGISMYYLKTDGEPSEQNKMWTLCWESNSQIPTLFDIHQDTKHPQNPRKHWRVLSITREQWQGTLGEDYLGYAAQSCMTCNLLPIS